MRRIELLAGRVNALFNLLNLYTHSIDHGWNKLSGTCPDDKALHATDNDQFAPPEIGC